MSTTAPAVQPDTSGQGGENAAPYQQYLEQIPEEHRGLVEPAFKRWDADVTRRFQDHSQFRDQWSPYAETGINQFDPQAVSQLVAFAQLASDPEQFKGWLQQQAQQHGLLQQQAADAEPVDPSLESLLYEQLGPLRSEIDEFKAWRQQQELTSQQGQVEQEMNDRFAELCEQHRGLEDQAEAVDMFIPGALSQGLTGAAAVDRAVADYQSLVAQTEQRFVGKKTDVPAPPAVPGAPNTGAAEITDPKQATEAALAYVRQMNQS
jgi:hypothetical protein